MLAGKYCLTRCCSLSTIRAQPRFVSPSIPHLPKHVAPIHPQASLYSTTACSECVPSLCRDRVDHVKLSAKKTASFSTSSPVPVPAVTRQRTQQRKFLRPRNKPKFRVRTKAESGGPILASEKTRKARSPQSKVEAEECKEQEDVEQSSRSQVADDGKQPRFFDAAASSDISQQSPFFDSDFIRINPYLSVVRRTYLRSRNEAGVSELEQELHYLAHNDPNPEAIHSILKILITDRRIKPLVHFYEAAILANTWPEYGSVENVWKILSEMESESIEINSGIIAAVLKVLAIHPSIELSFEMLAMVERRWIQLSRDTRLHLVVAMIRTGQTELAAWTLDTMRSVSDSRSAQGLGRDIIPDYLVVLLIAEMVKLGDWEGVLRYVYKLRNRRAADREIPVSFWAWLLEKASKAARKTTDSPLPQSTISQHNTDGLQPNTHTPPCSLQTKILHSMPKTSPGPSTQPLSHYIQTQSDLSHPSAYLVQFLWTHYASSMSIHPSWSTCLDILHVAANTGRPRLAYSVITTMTYLDGVDETGVPRTEVSYDIRKVAMRAVHKAARLETRAAKREGRNLKAERKAAKEAEMKEKRRKDEYEVWWKQLMDQFDEEEKQQKDAVHPADSGSSQESTQHRDPKTSEPQVESDTLATGKEQPKSAHPMAAAAAASAMPDQSTTRAHSNPASSSGLQRPHPLQYPDLDSDPDPYSTLNPSNSPSNPEPDPDSDSDFKDNFNLFDARSGAPGNLWPSFPSIGSMGSAYVDPWDALGPRSSTRGKWTEAQKYYKSAEMAREGNRKSKNKNRKK